MNNKDISKLYEPSEVEKKWYKTWEANNCFAPSGDNESFTIMIPPPTPSRPAMKPATAAEIDKTVNKLIISAEIWPNTLYL